MTPILPEGFALVRDDLLHPLLGGNKQRKLDGLWPSLAQATDVVTCGGLQSAHTLAVAAACAERGKRCHLLVRGERPAVPTGTHLCAAAGPGDAAGPSSVMLSAQRPPGGLGAP